VDYVPDTSVIIDGRFTRFISKSKEEIKIIMAEAMVAEVEHQANQGRSTGMAALDELEKIRKITEEKSISIEFVGQRPTQWQKINGHNGEIDNMIRDIAVDYGATLVTGDIVQERIAKLKKINVLYLPPDIDIEANFEEFFAENTMSVHIKEDNFVKLKNGVPGNVEVVKTKRKVNAEKIRKMADTIIRRARNEQDSFIEIDWEGVTVVQLGKFRIVITKPPFSSGYEITAVRPLNRKDLSYYELPETILEKILSGSSGVLVGGSPGAGKSTLVQAIADHLNASGKIVKTMERPRDLQVDREITQYTVMENSMEKTGDILLLVRNDYTIFDEMRITSDFKVFADLRMAGVGMIGVVHATKPIDALHRFIGRIELGLIPQVVDTIIFVKDGRISEYLNVSHTVKVPYGMTQDDLARPVIQIRDALTMVEMYEVYTFGEQIVVVPVGEGEGRSEKHKIDMESVRERIAGYLGTEDVLVENAGKGRVRVTVPHQLRPKLIGKRGSRIDEIERKLGVRIDVVSTEAAVHQEIAVEIKNRIIYLHTGIPNQLVNIFADDMMFLQGRTSSKGIIRVKIDSETGINIERALKAQRVLSFSMAE
jgi:ATPase (PilT family)